MDREREGGGRDGWVVGFVFLDFFFFFFFFKIPKFALPGIMFLMERASM